MLLQELNLLKISIPLASKKKSMSPQQSGKNNNPNSCIGIIIILALVTGGIFGAVVLSFSLILKAMFPYSQPSGEHPVDFTLNTRSPSPLTTPNRDSEPVATPNRDSEPIATPSISSNNSLPTKRAMTWRVLQTAVIKGKSYALFGSDSQTNPYQGDTDINEVHSLLCIHKINLPAPLGLPSPTTTTGGALRGSWSGGQALIIPNIQAKALTSALIANETCRAQGQRLSDSDELRMAEFHDGDRLAGSAGWDFWAEVSSIEGLDNPNIRYWVQINDQNSNPW